MVSEDSYPRPAFLGGVGILLFLALLKLLLHTLTADNYGYFRDELYYIAASEWLDLGYVDFPPFVAMVAATARQLFGDSLLALHVFPALSRVLVILLAGLMARELGGGRFAQGLAALATFIAPNFVVFGTWISMDAFDQLLWVLAVYVLLILLKRDQTRLCLPSTLAPFRSGYGTGVADQANHIVLRFRGLRRLVVYPG